MTLVRPRLNDHHGLAFTKEEVDFAIPFLDEDLPTSVAKQEAILFAF